MIKLQGVGASKGVVIGKTLVITENTVAVNKQSNKTIEEEIARLMSAADQATQELKKLEEHTQEHIGEEEAAIFEVHQMMISDGELTDRAQELIKDQLITAEYAMKLTGNEFASLFKSMEDPYMRERGVDIEDISKRIINLLTGQVENDLVDLKEPVIIVKRDLLPSDTVQMDKDNILGIITQIGSRMSHSSIIARSLQIPAVVGVEDAFVNIKNEDYVILDGQGGQLIINPDQAAKKQWIKEQQKYRDRLEELSQLKGTKSITKDGVEITVAANIGSPDDMESVLENDAEAIGLFRSEFLYMHSDAMPSEESQFQAYKTVLEQMGDKQVIIRTLDVGGDKEIPYLEIPKEDNPFLGYRGIRICLDQVDIFKTQLRALLRASAYGRLGIMFPMICTIEELRQAKAILEEVKDALRAEGESFGHDVEVGVMIETPAAVMVTDLLAKEVDFFSIGTNDLTQYTMAVDRMNPKVEYLYDTHNPSVLKMIEITAKNAAKENIWIGVCGEAGADPTLTQFFADVGINELSVNPGSVLEVREKIQSIKINKQ